MKNDEYQVMFQLEDTYWWYVGMRRIWFSLLDQYRGLSKARILDAGCGTGGNIEPLLIRGSVVVGADLSSQALAFCRKGGSCLDTLVQASVMSLPFADSSFDILTSFDVIYCVDNDVQTLQGYFRVLRPGGFLLLSAPAYNFLRSEHDIAVGTRRRYTRQCLRDLVCNAGFEIERLTYANTLLFPLIAAYRLLKNWRGYATTCARSDLRPLPSALNTCLARVLFIEASLLRKVNLPWGLSLICLAYRT